MSLFRLVVVIEMPSGVQANNVLYAQIPDSDSLNTTQMDNLIDAYVSNAYNDIVAVMSTIISIARVLVYLVDELDGSGIFKQEVSIAGSGVNGNSPLPHGVAAKIDFKVDDRPRASSIYVPGITTNNITSNGLFNSTVISAMLAFGVSISDNFTDPDDEVLQPVYWSQKDLTAFSIDGSSITFNDVPDYQRRRKPGVGT